MLTARVVVLDFEGFRSKKSGFIVKELAKNCENYTDTISFSPPHSFKSRALSEQKSYQRNSKYLHGLDWERGDYPDCYLQQILQKVALRFPLSDFYAKGVEKTDMLQKLLQRKVTKLEDLLCLKIEHLSFYRETAICDMHSTTCPKRQKNKHCARKKAQLFYYWLIHEQPSIGKNSTVCRQKNLCPNLIVYSCLTAENQLSVTFVKEEK